MDRLMIGDDSRLASAQTDEILYKGLIIDLSPRRETVTKRGRTVVWGGEMVQCTEWGRAAVEEEVHWG